MRPPARGVGIGLIASAALLVGAAAGADPPAVTADGVEAEGTLAPVPPPRVKALLEAVRGVTTLDPVVSLTSDGGLLYAATSGGRLLVHRRDLASGRVEIVAGQDRERDHFHPVRIGGRVLSLIDDWGDKRFRLDGGLAVRVPPRATPMRLFTDALGGLLLVVWRGAGNLESVGLFRPQAGVASPVGAQVSLPGMYAGHGFSPDGRWLLVGAERGLVLVDTTHGRSHEIAASLRGDKVSPVFDWAGGRILFASSGEGEFRELYQLAFTTTAGGLECDGSPARLLATEHDKNHLTVSDGFLYFVENVDNKHVIARVPLAGGSVERLSREGVVYRYVVDAGARRILASYSGLDGPVRLVSIELATGAMTTLAGSVGGALRMGRTRLVRPVDRSPAWRFAPRGAPRGVVLSLHGGPDIDVSPRWDPFLQVWLELGFVVVAPNYPGSRGYGKSFMARGPEASVADLEAWTQALRTEHPGQPIFLEALSYGGYLADRLLEIDPGAFRGAVQRAAFRKQTYAPTAATPPLLFLLGATDQIVPAASRVAEIRGWQQQGRRVWYRVHAREGHLVRSPAALEDALATIATFVERALDGR